MYCTIFHFNFSSYSAVVYVILRSLFLFCKIVDVIIGIISPAVKESNDICLEDKISLGFKVSLFFKLF